MTVGILSFGNPAYEGFVSNRARLIGTLDTTNKQIMTRSSLTATDNLTSIKVVFQNFTAGDTGPGATATVTASVEYPSGTIAATIKFSGSTSGTIPNAGVLFSDYTTAINIPNGATYWIRIYQTCTGGVYHDPAFFSAGLGDQTNVAVSGLTDQTQSTGSVTGGTPTVDMCPPLAVIARTNTPSVLLIGDSRTYGSADTGGSDMKVGNLARSMGSLAFCNIANSGATASGWLTSATARSALYPYGSQVIVALGINDLTNGRTAAQIANDVSNILAQTGAKYKYVITIEPKTSDGGTPSAAWTTTGQQTNLVANRVAYNTLVRAGISGAFGFYEVADAIESARNSTFWIVTPSPPYTGDGLHPNPAGYALISASGAIVPKTYP